MNLIDGAADTAHMLLADVGTRWPHVRRAATQARSVAFTVPDVDRDLLIAAAFLHDIGYAPSLAVTGLHQLDGARWLQEQGADPRLVGLVAHHTAAVVEAEERGLRAELDWFPNEASAVSDALWFADLTSSPTGYAVGPEERIEEILARYTAGSIVHASISRAKPVLLEAVDRVRRRVGAHGDDQAK